MKRINTYTLILNALGAYGPLTCEQLKRITRKKGIAARISEFNRYWSDIEISATNTSPKKYYISFLQKVHLKTKRTYPLMDQKDYHLRKKKNHYDKFA